MLSGKFKTSFLLFLLFSTRFLAAASQPWDASFASDTAALLKAANQIPSPEDQEVDVLLEDHHLAVDANGRARATLRKVYRVLRDDAVEDWSSVSETYQPWREQKPVIRARVITKTGSVHTLDPKTIADAPATEFDPSTFSDTRVIRAPLPAVESGALVEFEITTETAPAFAEAGVTRRMPVVDSVPLERFHVLIDAPTEAAVRTVYRQIPESAVRRTTSKAGIHIEFELGPLKPRKTFEGNLPPDASPFPYIAISTASSWQTLAARYADIVEKQIQSADVKALMPSLDLAGSPLAIAGLLATELHRNVRYTGVEFGESAVIPARPTEVLQRKFGDCKDKSALLVAMLRAAGLKASVALLKSGFGPDVDANLPGLDLFDHAIVYVDAPEPFWIDATANHARIGTLPAEDQGRFALIAAPQTTALVKIPEQANSLERRSYEIRFKDFGRGTITEVMESNSASEAVLRSAYAASDNPRSALEKYVKKAYNAKNLGTYEVSGKDDLSRPVRVSVQALDTPQVMTSTDSAQVILGTASLLQALPYELQEALDGSPSAPPKSVRTNDFLFEQAGVTEHTYKLYPPALYNVAGLPSSSKIGLGPLTLSRSYTTGPEGVVEVDYRLEIPRRRISPVEYEQLREALQKHASQSAERVNFVPQTAEFLAVGQTGKALALMRESVAKNDKDASAHIRLSRVLVAAGLGIPARTEAERATRIDPESSQAWQALAWSWQNDPFGRLRHGDWSRTEALRALRKAVELDPDDIIGKADLAILLEFNDQGERYGKGGNPEEAVALYQEMLKKQPNVVLESNLTAGLIYSGRLDEAAEEARKCADSQRVLFQATLKALQQGAGPAIVGLQTELVEPAVRGQYLMNIAFTMIHLRRYPEALTFAQAAGRATSMPQVAGMIELISRFKRYEEAKLPDTDPRAVEQKMIAMLIGDEDLTIEKVRELMVSAPPIATWEDDLKAIRQQALASWTALVDLGFTHENFVDITIGETVLEKEGDDNHGYRIFTTRNAAMPAMFVVKDGPGYKVLASTDSMEEIGHRVLDLLNRKNIEAAQWWLDKTIPSMTSGRDGWLPAAHGLWSGTVAATRGPDDIKVAAASLIGRYEGSKQAVAILQEAYPKARNPIEKAQIDLALCETFSKARRWPELVTAAKRLMTSKTFDSAGFEYLTRALEEQKDWKALEAAALDYGKSHEAPREPWRFIAIARILSGNTAGAADAVEKFKTLAIGSEGLELAAWNQIFQKKVTEETLDSIKKTEGPAAVQNPYLAALVSLQLKKTEDAQDALKKAIQNGDARTLDARAWVIYGDICDQYGFSEAAASAWARARSAKAATRDAQWALRTLDSAPR
jgi:tetratricopeptide (TPR) repeat protein